MTPSSCWINLLEGQIQGNTWVYQFIIKGHDKGQTDSQVEGMYRARCVGRRGASVRLWVHPSSRASPRSPARKPAPLAVGIFTEASSCGPDLSLE